MRINGKKYRTIWYEDDVVKIIDQTKLPHQFIIKDLKTIKDAVKAIKTMEVRGAPLIGGTAAYGIVLALQENNNLEFFHSPQPNQTVPTFSDHGYPFDFSFVYSQSRYLISLKVQWNSQH